MKCTGTSTPRFSRIHLHSAATSASLSLRPGISRVVISNHTFVWCRR
ncbi:Uncharacterised protein [Mycobacterium tuberculosis]|uniref:Uncharacterized protein n=1 Tax=Mycobacterium tuberculosis TaxID=1773 RepID=A0A916LF55_MYCTX|nr:Uncharacterised protein [Mycobacterium tuberculosis]